MCRTSDWSDPDYYDYREDAWKKELGTVMVRASDALKNREEAFKLKENQMIDERFDLDIPYFLRFLGREEGCHEKKAYAYFMTRMDKFKKQMDIAFPEIIVPESPERPLKRKNESTMSATAPKRSFPRQPEPNSYEPVNNTWFSGYR